MDRPAGLESGSAYRIGDSGIFFILSLWLLRWRIKTAANAKNRLFAEGGAAAQAQEGESF